MKGWKSLVDDAVTRVIHDEIKRQLDEKFPEVKAHKGERAQPGFDYSLRRYIEDRYTEILKADPEIDALIKEHLKAALIRGLSDDARKGEVVR